MQFGIYTVGDVTQDPTNARTPSESERIQATLQIAQKAEDIGLDVFATGEHHNPPFITSSPTTLLAYIAAKTQRIILSTSTTLISTNDPVRLAEEYSLLQNLCGGRMDLMLGRGNTAPVYPWFGKSIADGLPLAMENYRLLHRLWREEDLNWSGRFRTPLKNFTSIPRPSMTCRPSSGTARSAPRKSPNRRRITATVFSPATSSGPVSISWRWSSSTARGLPITVTARRSRRSSASAGIFSCAATRRMRAGSSVPTSTTPRCTAMARRWKSSWK